MSTEITASWETLMNQASHTAENYMRDAITTIDQMFGAGYAKGHPELVAAYMNAAAQDFHATATVIAGQRIERAIRNLETFHVSVEKV